MSSLARCVGRAMRQRALVRASDRVALAVSGGADSVAMAWILRELEVRAAWRLAGLIHVHHGLRGAAADADEAFTRALAARLDLPIHVSKVDVAAQAAAAGRSIEAVAREARYACFEAGAEALSASRVATAHTLDDQAETVLLRLLRGAGARGLSAIRPRRGLYVRPLLDCRRADLRDYLAARGEAFREDESNADLTIPRNRLRHTLLATIGAEWPGGIEALARVAESAASDERFLMRLALALAPGIGLDAAGGVQLQTEVLNAAPAALARRLVRHAIELVGGLPSARDLDEVRRLSRADTSDGALDLHRVRLVRSGRVLRFERRAGALRGRAGAAAFEYALTVPGMVKIRETGATITASFEEGDPPPFSPALVRLPAGVAAGPLVIRNRRPGDRMRPFGAPGSRKLQDVFVDRKIPREERDRIPVVADARGRIVWIAGVVAAEVCRVTRPEAGVVILKFKKGTQ